MIQEEFKFFSDANPSYKLPKVAPSISKGEIIYPTRSQYIEAIQDAANSAKYEYFGIYFTGTTFWQTGDWAVLSDCRKFVDSISLTDIYEILKSVKYFGSLWISVDAPFSGKWSF